MANLRTCNKVIIQATSPGAPINSEILDITNIDGYSFHIILTGTFACTIALAGSNDIVNKTMTVLSDSTNVLPAGSSFIYNNFSQKYKYVQVQMSAPAGAGNITVIYNAKVN